MACFQFFRKIICRLPKSIKIYSTDFIALFIYLPMSVSKFQKSYLLMWIKYHYLITKTLVLYMKTDALDRFGTPLEKRFTKNKKKQMCLKSGLVDISFSNKAPFWCCVGYKNK